MKTTGAVWNEYMKSWPDGQWFDDSDESIDGLPMEGVEAPSDSVITFTCGVVFKDNNDQTGKSLVSHFRAWLKTRDCKTFVWNVPSAKADEFKAYLKSIGAQEVAA